jgi:2-keto-4-pentenoate hydratase
VEVEPAFVLKHSVGGPNVTAVDIMAATDFVVPALEIIDSRVKDWEIEIWDTLADGGSCGAVIVGGAPRLLSEVNLANTAGDVLIDGQVAATGNTNAAYGNPIGALAWLCRRISEYGIGLEAGQLILPGSILAAERLEPGHRVTGRFEGWGEVSFDYVS